jgi:hypothetical protein
MGEVGEIEHDVEGSGELTDEGPVQSQAEVAPAAVDAVAVADGSDVEAADDGESIVADEEFAVIADVEAME